MWPDTTQWHASWLCVAAGLLTGIPASYAQKDTYPTRPVRIVTSVPGSSLDLAARVVAQGLTQSLGEQVIVENRNVLTVETVVKATPDGYTLLAYGNSTWLAPMLSPVTYDAVKDLALVDLTVMAPNVLVVYPKVAATSVRELVALAKSQPGKLNYGSSVTAGTPHLAAELFKYMAGVDIVRVPYKGVAPAVNDLIGGRLDLMFPVAATGMPHVRAGRLRALGVSSAKPSVLAPEVPTIASQGLPGYEFLAMHGIMAPAKIPPALVARLHKEINAYVTQPEVKTRLLNSGLEVISGSPREFVEFRKNDISSMGKLFKAAHIRAE